MRKKLLVVVAAFALALCMPAMAFAANSAFDKGTAESTSYVDSYTGNAFLMERDALNLTVGRDLYWVGDTLNARGLEVGGGTGGSALLAGSTLNVASSAIHGSLRAAGQTVNVSSTTVGNNITVAGQNVSIASDVSAGGVYAAGSNVSVSGTYQGAAFAAGTVNLAGSYAGDVNVSAGTVNVSKGTTVGGTLRVPNNAQVTIEEGANVPNVSYVDDALVSTVSEGSEQNPFSVIGPLLFSCMAHALLVLLFFFLIKGAMESAVKLTETKLPRMFVLGFAEFFVLPLLGLFLLFPLVTAPISALIFIFIAVLWMFSIPFAGYVLGRRLFGGHGAFGRRRDRNACSYCYLLYPVSLLRGANRMLRFRCGLPYAKLLGQARFACGAGSRFRLGAVGLHRSSGEAALWLELGFGRVRFFPFFILFLK